MTSPRLEVAEGTVSVAVLVMVRARHGVDGSLCGTLYLPEGANRASVLKDMKIAADAFNQNGDWVEVLHHLPPNPPPERIRLASQATPTLAVSGRAAPATVPPVERGDVGLGRSVPVPPLPSALPVPHPAPMLPPLPKAGTDSKPDNHVRFLMRVLEGKQDGIFTGKEAVPLARSFFPGKTDRWYATGAVQELCGRGWVRRIGTGQYEVEQAFLDQYPLIGLFLVPHEKLPTRRGKVKARSSVPAPGTVGVSDLLRQRAEIDRQLTAERARRESAVTAAREALARAEAGVTAARELLASAEVALVEIDQALGKP